MVDGAPLWISLKTAIASTSFAFVGGIAAAYAMVKDHPQNHPHSTHKTLKQWQGWVDGLLTLPLILPPTVVGFILLMLLGLNGPIGQLLEPIGITLLFSWPATVIASTVVAFPLMYKTVLGAFRQVDGTVLDCARTLGASEQRVFFQILLPLAWPGVMAGTILAFARALGEFGATLMLAGNIPGKTETMPMAIFFAGEAGRLDEALMWTLILVSIALGAICTLNYVSLPSRSKTVWDFTLKADSVKIDSVHFNEVSNTHPTGFLDVDIRKDLANLTVMAGFTTNTNPLAILGASGAGKSTLLRCVAGLLQPDEGRIVLNHQVLFDAKSGVNVPSAHRRVGFVFQHYALFPHMTVTQNVAFGVQNLSRQVQHDRISYYLQLLQLQHLADAYPHQLSGGQQQRVALARALAPHPEVLLLDEPLSALDPHLRDRIQHHLAQIFATYSGAVLFVTHNLTEAYRLCDRWLVLSDGQISADGDKRELCDRPPTYAVAQLTDCKNLSRIELRATSVEPHSNAALVQALDWNNIILQVPVPLPQDITYISIRPHQISLFLAPREDPLGEQPVGDNVFPSQILSMVETQQFWTIHLALGLAHLDDNLEGNLEGNSYRNTDNTAHLQAEVDKNRGAILYSQWQNAESHNRFFCWVRLDMNDLRLMSN